MAQVKRYQVVTATLEQEIKAGRHRVGDDLPTEAELCARFTVSRFTAREALRRLEEAGFIQRRQGSGSRVIASDPAARYVASMGSEADVLRYARDTVLIAGRRWSPAKARHLKDVPLDPDRKWLHLEGVRRIGADGPAIGFTDVWVDSAFEPHLPQVDPGRSESIFAQLSESAGITIAEIHQEIYSDALGVAVARRLGSDAGAPALVVVRRYRGEAGIFEVARTIHPADRFRYELTLRHASR